MSRRPAVVTPDRPVRPAGGGRRPGPSDRSEPADRRRLRRLAVVAGVVLLAATSASETAVRASPPRPAWIEGRQASLQLLESRSVLRVGLARFVWRRGLAGAAAWADGAAPAGSRWEGRWQTGPDDLGRLLLVEVGALDRSPVPLDRVLAGAGGGTAPGASPAVPGGGPGPEERPRIRWIGVFAAFLTFLLQLALVAGVLYLALLQWRRFRRRRREGDPAGPRCDACGYLLRGTATDRCPECGASLRLPPTD